MPSKAEVVENATRTFVYSTDWGSADYVDPDEVRAARIDGFVVGILAVVYPREMAKLLAGEESHVQVVLYVETERQVFERMGWPWVPICI